MTRVDGRIPGVVAVLLVGGIGFGGVSAVEAQHAPYLVFAEDAPGSMQVPHDEALNPGAAFTIEMWVHLMDTEDCTSLLGKNWQEAYWLGVCSGSVRTYTHGSDTSATSGQVIEAREWVHVAATFADGVVKHYVNGEFVQEYAASEDPVPATDDLLGIGWDPAWSPSPFGALDEVRLWNVARSESEIAAGMDEPISDAVAGLVASWNFDGDASDSVGGHHGTLSGVATVRTELPQPETCAEESFVPAAAHAAGVGGSQWRTDFFARNRNASEGATVTIELMPRDSDNSDRVSVSYDLAAAEVLPLKDIVLSAFGEDSMAAALRVCGTEPLHVSTRTFNQSDGGTFGQAIPGLAASAAIGDGGTGWLIGLAESETFRTNIGFTNTSNSPASVKVTFFDGAGVELGTLDYTVPPFGHRQISSPFGDVTGDEVTDGSVSVLVSDSDVIVYASVVDNATDDGTFLLAQ